MEGEIFFKVLLKMLLAIQHFSQICRVQNSFYMAKHKGTNDDRVKTNAKERFLPVSLPPSPRFCTTGKF